MPVQTSYGRSFSGNFVGAPGDTGLAQDDSFLNASGGDIQAGIAVTLSGEGKITNLAASTDKIAGIVLNTFARNPDSLTGSNAIKSLDMANVRAVGRVYVAVEEAVVPGDAVYVRHTANGGNTVKGKFRNDADTNTCRKVRGARFITAGDATTPPLMQFNADVDAACFDL